jgi:hypothetical protein
MSPVWAMEWKAKENIPTLYKTSSREISSQVLYTSQRERVRPCLFSAVNSICVMVNLTGK